MEPSKETLAVREEIRQAKERMASLGYKSCEGFYFDENGVPHSIDPDVD
jgi:hypothetical protein